MPFLYTLPTAAVNLFFMKKNANQKTFCLKMLASSAVIQFSLVLLLFILLRFTFEKIKNN